VRIILTITFQLADEQLAVANACYFNIGARLARYTANATYGELAEKTWDLMERLGYIGEKFDVYDGAHLPDCTGVNKAQFSYNAGMIMQGCAYMYNVVCPSFVLLLLYFSSCPYAIIGCS
jgi:hypothetical protein